MAISGWIAWEDPFHPVPGVRQLAGQRNTKEEVVTGSRRRVNTGLDTRFQTPTWFVEDRGHTGRARVPGPVGPRGTAERKEARREGTAGSARAGRGRLTVQREGRAGRVTLPGRQGEIGTVIRFPREITEEAEPDEFAR